MYLHNKEPPFRCQCVFHVSNLNFSVFICLPWRCSGQPGFRGESSTLTLCVPHGSEGTAAKMQQGHVLLFHQLLREASKAGEQRAGGLRGPCSLLSCPVRRRQKNIPKISCPRPSRSWISRGWSSRGWSSRGWCRTPCGQWDSSRAVSQGGLWVTPLGLCPVSVRPGQQPRRWQQESLRNHQCHCTDCSFLLPVLLTSSGVLAQAVLLTLPGTTCC